MSTLEVADFLKYICDMQATECITDARKMFHATGSQLVNHHYASWSSEQKLGLVDFLDCLGVQRASKRDVEASINKVNHVFCIRQGTNAEELQSSYTNRLNMQPNLVFNRVTEMSVNNETGIDAKSSVCANCGAVSTTSALKRCSRCLSVRYCNEACQRAHWKQHRKNCTTAPST
jgi:MYND finger